MNRGVATLAFTGAMFVVSATACAQPSPSPAASTPAYNDGVLQRAIRAAHPTIYQRIRISRIMRDKQVTPGARAELIQAVFTTDQRKRFLAALQTK